MAEQGRRKGNGETLTCADCLVKYVNYEKHICQTADLRKALHLARGQSVKQATVPAVGFHKQGIVSKLVGLFSGNKTAK